jgi:hypothetical protein
MKPLLVHVVNTSAEPVPVIGNISASGTVNAVQSGTWNVGLTGGPRLNSSRPTLATVQTRIYAPAGNIDMVCIRSFNAASDTGAVRAMISGYLVAAGE